MNMEDKKCGVQGEARDGREAFESWADGQGFVLDCDFFDVSGQHYDNDDTQLAYDIWQAALASRPAPPAAERAPVGDERAAFVVTANMIRLARDAYDKAEFPELNRWKKALYAALASAPVAGEAHPAIILKAVDEYGLQLDWTKHWVEYPIGTKFYTAPQASTAADERDAWRHLAAAVYQAAGAYSMPARVLDALSAAAEGLPFSHLIESILPVEAPQVERDAKETDPLQGAANWLVKAIHSCKRIDIQKQLLLGPNRAQRLYDAAIDAQKGEGAEV